MKQIKKGWLVGFIVFAAVALTLIGGNIQIGNTVLFAKYDRTARKACERITIGDAVSGYYKLKDDLITVKISNQYSLYVASIVSTQYGIQEHPDVLVVLMKNEEKGTGYYCLGNYAIYSSDLLMTEKIRAEEETVQGEFKVKNETIYYD